MKIRKLIEPPNLARTISSTEFMYLDRYKHEFHTLIGRAELRIPYEKKFPYHPSMPKQHPDLANNPGKRQFAFPADLTWVQADLWKQAADIAIEKDKLDRTLMRIQRERDDAKAAAEEQYLRGIDKQQFRIEQTFVAKFAKEALFRELKKQGFENEKIANKIETHKQREQQIKNRELFREQRGWDDPSTLPLPLQGTGARNLFEYNNDQRMLHFTNLSSDVHDLKDILKRYDAQMMFLQASYGLIATGHVLVANLQTGVAQAKHSGVESVAPTKKVRLLT